MQFVPPSIDSVHCMCAHCKRHAYDGLCLTRSSLSPSTYMVASMRLKMKFRWIREGALKLSGLDLLRGTGS